MSRKPWQLCILVVAYLRYLQCGQVLEKGAPKELVAVIPRRLAEGCEDSDTGRERSVTNCQGGRILYPVSNCPLNFLVYECLLRTAQQFFFFPTVKIAFWAYHLNCSVWRGNCHMFLGC